MRIDLGQLSVQGLSLELPGTQVGQQPKRVRVDSADELRGSLVQSASGIQLTNVVCPRLLVSKLEWLFGTLGLRAEQAAQLTGLAVEVSTTSGELELDLKLSGLGAKLELSVGNLRMVAEVDAQGLSLLTGPAVGRLLAERALFSALQVRTASLSIALPSLSVEGLLVDWGGDAFVLEATKLEGGELTLDQAGAKLRGSGLSVSGLHVRGASVLVAQASLARLDVAAELPAPAAPDNNPERDAAPTRHASTPPVFDYELLNGLAGHLNVDVAVDLAVPIIGRRRATHELRIVLEDGALDYRELENNLARLEDSLLDFSVRDGALVLERGLPLISTRGRGKPIVIWDLSPEDLALAQDRRVRLAVLPKARLAASSGQSEPPPQPEPHEESSSSFRLRHLSLQDIDAALRLVATGGGRGALRELTFASLTLQGTVHHDPEGSKREGRVRGALSDLRTTLAGLPVGRQHVGTTVELASVREIDLTFDDVKPRRASAVVEGLVVRALSLA